MNLLPGQYIRKLIAAIFLVVSAVSHCHAQKVKTPGYEEMEAGLKTEKNDSVKAAYYIALSFHYRDTDNKKAQEMSDNALKLAQKLNNNWLKFQALSAQGASHSVISDFKSSIYSHFKALKIAEEMKDSSLMAQSFNNIAIVYSELKNFDVAISYYFKAGEIFKSKNETWKLSHVYNNLGNIAYAKGFEKNEFDSAIYFYNLALPLKIKTNDIRGEIMVRNNLALTLCDNKMFNEAEVHALKALHMSDSAKLESQIISALNGLGRIYQGLKNYKKSLQYYETAFKKAKEFGDPKSLFDVSVEMSEVYRDMGDYKKAYEYYVIYSSYKDSVFNESTTDQINELQIKYDTEKKEKEIVLLSKDKALQASEIEKQKNIKYFISGITLLVIILALVLLAGYRNKRKANELLFQQKEEIAMKNEELHQQNEEIMAQRDEIEKQKDLVEIKNQEITDSIYYARRIQRALLTSESYIKKFLPEFFILYKPKDIVSGDFYWCGLPTDGAGEKGSRIIVTVADCTGHGVPGAFMSMMGINFLNQIVVEQKTSNPHEILNLLREDLIAALNPNESDTDAGEDKSENAVMDGMDMALCLIDKQAENITIAAANNPVWIARHQGLSKYEIEVVTPDKMPVGKYHGDFKLFAQTSVSYKKGDIIYLFSDGYADQFGGPDRKKFKYKPLKELLTGIAHLDMEGQKKILNKTFEEWKGLQEQIDDVLIVGIRL